MRRRVVLLLLLFLLVSVTGCLSPLPEEDEVDYGDRWNTESNVTYYLDENTFTAVVRLDGYEDEFEVWQRDPFGGDNPVNIAGVRFRTPDGNVTQIDREDLDVSGDRTVVDLPGDEGRVAYTGEKTSTDFTHPSPVEGNVTVHLPPSTDARNFFLGDLSPGGNEIVSENPLVFRWANLKRGTYVTVEYYRKGYPLIFAGAVIILSIAAIVVVYYYKNFVLGPLRRKRNRRRP